MPKNGKPGKPDRCDASGVSVSKRPRKVAAADLVGPGRTSGVTRLQAFAGEKFWVGAVLNEPREMSGWHAHPGHDTYAYCAAGTLCFEYGPGGADRIDVQAGDFVLIPAGLVHREGNPGDVPSKVIAFRIGEGALVVDLDGPEPASG